MKQSKILSALLLLLPTVLINAQTLDPLDMRWTFGAHEPYLMYRRVGVSCTGGIDGNAKWVQTWLDWFDSKSPEIMQELGLNWLHCRFDKGMGWEVEKEDFPKIKCFVDNCHEHGVHALAYVQIGTLYPELMKKEIINVESWQAIGEDGKPFLWKPETYYRTVPCINCPEWEEYVKKLCTIALLDGGFDGVMFDNAFSADCCCERCQESFRNFLQNLPDKEERFGLEDLSGFSIPSRHSSRNVSDEIRDPLIQAWIEWRTDCLTNLFARIRQHIKSVKPDAVISANSPTFRCLSNPTFRGVNMVELAETLDLIVGQSENYPAFREGKIINRVRELKIAREMAKPIVALCDIDAKMTEDMEKHYLLPLYEDLVFGGIPTDRTVLSPKPVQGFIDSVKIQKRMPQLQSFNDFVNGHKQLFTAPVYAPVRLLYPEFEIQFSKASQEHLCAAEEILTRRQIPWSYLISTPEEPFDVPDGTEVIVVPGLLCLSHKQVDGLIAWAESGGKLVITGDSGRYDGYNAQYLENPLLPKVSNFENVVIKQIVDEVTPAVLAWTNNVGVPEDHGEALLDAIWATGFSLPFTITGCPEHVAVDVRKTDAGFIIHFVNFAPSIPINSIKVKFRHGRQYKIRNLFEYGYVEI